MPTYLKLLDNTAASIRKLNNSMLPTGGILVVIIASCSVYGILLRGWGTPVSWPLELTELLQVALAFLPAAYVLNSNKHVSMEVINVVLSSRARRVARLFVNVIGMVVCAVMIYATIGGALSSYAMREATILVALPIYPFKFVVTVGYAMLSLQFLGHFWEELRNLNPDTGHSTHGVQSGAV